MLFLASRNSIERQIDYLLKINIFHVLKKIYDLYMYMLLIVRNFVYQFFFSVNGQFLRASAMVILKAQILRNSSYDYFFRI